MQHGLAAADRAAIYTVSGRPSLEFTGDREKLQDTVRRLRAQPPVSHGSLCPVVSYFLADLIQNKGNEQALEVLVQRTMQCPGVKTREIALGLAWAAVRREVIVGAQDDRVVLGSLRRAIRRLAGMPGQRILVIASPGFFAETPEAIRERADLLDQAAKARVIISAVDPRGVYVVESDASELGALSRPWLQLLRTGAAANDDALAELAQGTGGAFFHNSNDLTAGFERVAAAPEFSYVIGFSPAAWKADGSFHSIKVVVPNQKRVSVEARRGYYALTQDPADQAARESMDDAVFSREEINEIPVEVQTQYSHSGAGAAKLTVAANVDVRSLHFQKIDDRNHDSLTLVIALFDPDGGYVTGITKTVDLALRDGTLTKMDRGLKVPAEFDVRPGTYMVRLVVRESESNAMSARNAVATIP
jgi:VWFA-related protein